MKRKNPKVITPILLSKNMSKAKNQYN